MLSPDGVDVEQEEQHNTYEVAPCRLELERLLRSKQGEHQVLSRQQRRIQLGGGGGSKAALVQQSPPSSWRPKVMIGSKFFSMIIRQNFEGLGAMCI